MNFTTTGSTYSTYLFIILASLLISTSVWWGLSGGFSFMGGSKTTQEYLSEGYAALNPETYNLEKAGAAFRAVLKQDPAQFYALYALMRISLATNNMDAASLFAERALAVADDRTPVLYTRALIAGYKGQYAAAETWMREFILETDTPSWQEHLDLAWFLFAQQKYTETEQVLLGAIETFGSNAWLQASLSGVYIAQDKKELAGGAIEKGKSDAALLTIEDWRENYALNNPKEDALGIEKLKAVFDLHEKVLVGGVVTESDVPDIFASHVDVRGPQYGMVVSACGGSCSVRFGDSCTASNQCGVVDTGTYNCQGACSASASLPSQFGSACSVSTACGPAAGRINCNGQCSVFAIKTSQTCEGTLVLGDDSEYETDSNGNHVPKFGCGNAKVKIIALPLVVRAGRTTVINWISNEARSCTVTGNGQTWTGLLGTQLTLPISETSRFTVTCQPMTHCSGAQAQPFSASIEVRVAPEWEEI